MLKDHDSSAIRAVADLERARAFYGGVLGLDLAGEWARGSNTIPASAGSKAMCTIRAG